MNGTEEEELGGGARCLGATGKRSTQRQGGTRHGAIDGKERIKRSKKENAIVSRSRAVGEGGLQDRARRKMGRRKKGVDGGDGGCERSRQAKRYHWRTAAWIWRPA
jgi:hypothetical protein